MIFYYDNNNAIIKTIPEQVFQGAESANVIYFVSPKAATSAVTVAFRLPNGFVTQKYLMTNQGQLNGIETPDGVMFNTWEFTLPANITAYAGTATAQFFISTPNGVVATQIATFNVLTGVPPLLPETPTADVYSQILSALSTIETAVYDTNGTYGLTYTVSYGSAEVTGYNGDVPNIVIPKYYVFNGQYYPVTSISEYALDDNNYKSLILPDTMNLIGPSAFANNEYLSVIRIPKNVTSISYEAFENDTALKTIVFEGYVERIQNDSFSGVTGATAYVPQEYYDYYVTALSPFKGITVSRYANLADITELQSQITENKTDIANNAANISENTQSIQNEVLARQSADTALNSRVTILENAGFITKSVNDLLNYYTKTDTYTKTEVQSLIAGLTGVSFTVVEELPETGESNIIYLVPKTGSDNDYYNEYIYVSDKWELIGSTQIDLTNYYTKEQINAMLNGYVPTARTIAGIALTANITAQQLKTALGIDTPIKEVSGVQVDKTTDNKLKVTVSSSDGTTTTPFEGSIPLSDLADQTLNSSSERPIANKAVNTALSSQSTRISALENAGFITKSVNDLANYYLKSQTYTKQEVNDLVSTLTGTSFLIVATLPATGNAGTIYLVPKTGSTNDIYDEYIYINNQWERIGSTEIDLSQYVPNTRKIADIPLSSDISVQQLNTALNNKVNPRPLVNGNTFGGAVYFDRTKNIDEFLAGLTYTTDFPYAHLYNYSLLNTVMAGDTALIYNQLTGNSYPAGSMGYILLTTTATQSGLGILYISTNTPAETLQLFTLKAGWQVDGVVFTQGEKGNTVQLEPGVKFLYNENPNGDDGAVYFAGTLSTNVGYASKTVAELYNNPKHKAWQYGLNLNSPGLSSLIAYTYYETQLTPAYGTVLYDDSKNQYNLTLLQFIASTYNGELTAVTETVHKFSLNTTRKYQHTVNFDFLRSQYDAQLSQSIIYKGSPTIQFISEKANYISFGEFFIDFCNFLQTDNNANNDYNNVYPATGIIQNTADNAEVKYYSIRGLKYSITSDGILFLIFSTSRTGNVNLSSNNIGQVSNFTCDSIEL